MISVQRVRFVSAIFLFAFPGLTPPTFADEEKVVNVYNWADYIGPTTLEDFEAEFGIEVNYDIYDTSETVDAKLMTGNTGYDLVLHAGSFSARLIPVGIFQPLDKMKLPNWKHNDPELLEILTSYNDPGNQFAAPYMWGTTGFAYNVDMVLERMPDAPLDSADLVFKPEIVSRFADCGVSILDSPLDVIPVALKYLGYAGNSADPLEISAAGDLLTSVRPYIKYFSSVKLLNDLPNKETCISMSWSGDYAQALTRAAQAGVDIDLDYFIPKEGSIAWFDALLIPSDAPHPDNAHIFLNYLMRPEVIASISNHVFYANCNKSATPLVNPEITGNPSIYPDEEVMKRLTTTQVLPPKAERARTRTWSRVKTGI